MICPNCQSENENDAKTCSTCGANLEDHSDSLSSKLLFALVAFIVCSSFIYPWILSIFFVTSLDSSTFRIFNLCYSTMHGLALFAIPYAIKDKNMKLIAYILLAINLLKNLMVTLGAWGTLS